MEEVKKKTKVNHIQNLLFVFGLLVNTVSVIIIFCSAYLFIQFLVKPNTPPTIFGVTPQIVLTNDMSGNAVGHVESGDLILIKKVPIETIELQNVVAYINNGDILVSRVTDIRVNGHIKLVVQADNDDNEFLVNDGEILGTVAQRVSCVGGFIYFTQSTIGIILFITIPAIILISLLICDIINKKKQSAANKKDSKENKKNADSQQEKEKPEIGKKANNIASQTIKTLLKATASKTIIIATSKSTMANSGKTNKTVKPNGVKKEDKPKKIQKKTQ